VDVFNVYVAGGSGVISHAPQGPYFGAIGGNTWAGKTGKLVYIIGV
jgi:hypothetical protein